MIASRIERCILTCGAAAIALAWPIAGHAQWRTEGEAPPPRYYDWIGGEETADTSLLVQEQENGEARILCRTRVDARAINIGGAAGKTVAGKCNVGWSGQELTSREFERLVVEAGSEVAWVDPARAVSDRMVDSGYQASNGLPIQVCRARYDEHWHFGTLSVTTCSIGYGGEEIATDSFEVLQVWRAGPGQADATNASGGSFEILDGISVDRDAATGVADFSQLEDMQALELCIVHTNGFFAAGEPKLKLGLARMLFAERVAGTAEVAYTAEVVRMAMLPEILELVEVTGDPGFPARVFLPSIPGYIEKMSDDPMLIQVSDFCIREYVPENLQNRLALSSNKAD